MKIFFGRLAPIISVAAFLKLLELIPIGDVQELPVRHTDSVVDTGFVDFAKRSRVGYKTSRLYNVSGSVLLK